MKALMGSGASKSNEDKAKDQEQVNREIEKELKRQKLEDLRVLQLLLLGGAESGKSTFAKQMKILHQNGFSEHDLINYTYLIQDNVVTCMAILLQQMIDQNACFKDPIFQKNIVTHQKTLSDRTGRGDFDEDLGRTVKTMWMDPGVQAFFKDFGHTFYMPDSAKYFLDNLDRISEPGYRPTDDDVLRSRAATTGIVETAFQYKKIKFRLIDVGGQRSERRKWIHCFENVTAIQFIVAMSEYDLTVMEDESANRMHESLKIFHEVAHNPIFSKTSIILFLNKKDIFMEKIKTVPLTVCYPDYKGKMTYEATSQFIKEQYMKQVPKKSGEIYCHFTNATDTKNVDKVFNSAMDTIFKQNMDSVGIA